MERQIPSILFIGTPGLNWHGVDLLVKFAKYAKNRIHFHVVGFNDTSTTESLSNITFHGYLPMEKYSEIARQCSIGLGTLALHRKNMMEACPLKVREYLSAGLPSVLPYKDTAFLDERPDWILNVSSSEDGLSKEAMEKVIEFAQEYKDYIIPKEDVLKYIDSNALEQKRVDFFSCIAK
nr:glycosyltransferase [Pseudoalteromonas sp. MMG005]